jgi:hypothetical protein
MEKSKVVKTPRYCAAAAMARPMEKLYPSCCLPKIMMVRIEKNRHLQDHTVPLRTISLRDSLFDALAWSY